MSSGELFKTAHIMNSKLMKSAEKETKRIAGIEKKKAAQRIALTNKTITQ